MENRYRAFGLTIESEIELPSLRESDSAPDVFIQEGQIDLLELEKDTEKMGNNICHGDMQFWFRIDGIAQFHITEGKHIRVETAPGADPQSVRLFLLGTALGVLMYQRGLFVLHANAIRFGNHCIAVAGHSGNGKSTLAAAFHQAGYEILSDDLAVIDDQGKVHPGYPQIKLWEDSANRLGMDISSMRLISLERKKYIYPLKKGFCSEALPLAALYIIEPHEKASFDLQPIRGMEKIVQLNEHSYRSSFLGMLNVRARHLETCGRLAENISAAFLKRPEQGFDVDRLIEVIEHDISRQMNTGSHASAPACP